MLWHCLEDTHVNHLGATTRGFRVEKKYITDQWPLYLTRLRASAALGCSPAYGSRSLPPRSTIGDSRYRPKSHILWPHSSHIYSKLQSPRSSPPSIIVASRPPDCPGCLWFIHPKAGSVSVKSCSLQLLDLATCYQQSLRGGAPVWAKLPARALFAEPSQWPQTRVPVNTNPPAAFLFAAPS